MNTENPALRLALKTLWGAAEMPFGGECPQPFLHPGFEEHTRPFTANWPRTGRSSLR